MNPSNKNFTINKHIEVFPLMNKIVMGKTETFVEPRIMRLLILFCSKPGEVISKSTLIATIWASKWINEEGLTKAISILRKTLNDPLLIKTVPKQGYSFEGDVEILPNRRPILFGTSEIPVRSVMMGASSLFLIIIFSFIFLDKDVVESSSPSFDYQYMTSTKGLHLYPAISSTDLIAFIKRNESDERFQLIVKSTKSDRVLFQSTDEQGDVFYPVFSPTADAVAFISKESGSTLLNVLTLTSQHIKTIYQLGNNAITQVDWSSDGNMLVFNDRPSDAQHYDLYIYDLQTTEVNQLTNDDYNEFNPVFSSDGRHIAFLQCYSNGVQKNLSVYSMQSNKVKAVKKIEKTIFDHDWIDQDQGLLFTSRDGFSSFIHKLNLSNGQVSQISNQNFSQISVDRNRILASKYMSDNNIWVKSLNAIEGPSELVVSSSRYEMMGVTSPDRSKIVYASDRSGRFQLWVYDFKNEESKPLTFLDASTTFDNISWSPDSKFILTGIRNKGGWEIIRISIENVESEILLDDNNIDRFPEYKSDENFHFISDRSGKKELWNYDFRNGRISKLTNMTKDMDYAQIGADCMLYFAQEGVNGIWKSSLTGENETKLICNDKSDYNNWELVGNYIYHINRSTVPPTISMLNTKTSNETVLQELLPDNQSWNARISVSHDQRYLVYNQADHYESDIIMMSSK